MNKLDYSAPEIKLISFESDGKIMLNDVDIDGDIAGSLGVVDTSTADSFDKTFGF